MRGRIFLLWAVFFLAVGPGPWSAKIASVADPAAKAEPDNLDDLDFPVPWGLRYGQPSRNYFEVEIGEGGEVVKATLIRAVPHENYAGIAKTTVKKFVYPEAMAGDKVLERLDYCIRTDGQSTFACRIDFIRLGVEDEAVAKAPGEPGFFRIDSYQGHPRVLKSRLPEYPEQAARRNLCGFVHLAFQVSKWGRARKIRVLESTYGGLFSLSAVNAVKSFEFEPPEGEANLEYMITYDIPGGCQD